MAETKTLDLGKVVPEKGVDYWTDEDKKELATEVLPSVTPSDNGKVLMVVDGVWVAAEVEMGTALASAEGVGF